MDKEKESMKSGVLTFLKANKKSGFTEGQILTAFFGNPENATESDVSRIRGILESLVEEKAVTKNTIRAKSGVKVYYQGA